MARGFLYLVAVMDWASRKVLAWRLSNTMEADFCVEALGMALARYGPPGIMNTDQGSQFIGWPGPTAYRRPASAFDGRQGPLLDNIFVERLWRFLNYECVYLHAWSGGREARAAIGNWIRFYNQRRPHAAFGGRTPDLAYRPPADQADTDRRTLIIA